MRSPFYQKNAAVSMIYPIFFQNDPCGAATDMIEWEIRKNCPVITMKRLQPLIGSLLAILLILSVVVFPAAETNRIAEKQAAEPFTPVSVETVPGNTDEALPPLPTFNDGPTAPVTFKAAEKPATDDANVAPLPFDQDDADTAAAVADNAAERAVPAASTIERVRKIDVPEVKTIDSYFSLTTGEDYKDVITSPDERHIYTFSVAQRGYLQYAVKHGELHNFSGWEATLYREYYLNGVDGEIGYRALNVLQTTALNTADRSPTVGLMPGEYRIVVRTKSGGSEEEFTLNAAFTEATDHEIECNDTKAAYTEIYPDVPMIGSASCYADHQDDDWYLLRLPKDGKAQITFAHAKHDQISVAWRVALYDENGTELYSENAALNKELIDSGEIGLTAGAYYLAVLCRTRCDDDYTLTVITTPDENFEAERNDTPETANELRMGGMTSGCITAKAGAVDRDYYRFEMTSRGNFALIFTHAPSALQEDKNGWNIRLYRDSGELLYKMIATWNNGAVRMPVIGLEEGVYYVAIDSEDLYRSNLTYTLIAGQNESGGFEREPNNTISTANPIPTGVSVTGTIVNAGVPDDDYYSFTLSEYSRVTVVLKHASTGSARDIFRFSVCGADNEPEPQYDDQGPITDASGNPVFFTESRGDQETVTGEYELAAGTYYIKVTSGRFFDNINYTVEYYLN